MRHNLILKERCEMKLETLQMKKEKVQAEKTAKVQEAHLQLLQQNAFLEKRLN
jgi:hypothetical protein